MERAAEVVEFMYGDGKDDDKWGCIELTPEVRRRLGKDGGVDGNDVFRVCYALHREENDMDAVDAAEKIMQLIADSEVKIDE